MLIALPPEELSSAAFDERLAALARAAPGRTFLAGVHRYRGDEPRRLGLLDELGARAGRAARRRQRCALSRPGAPAARRRAHLHPREMHHRAKQASGSPSTPNGISSRPRRWRGCLQAFPTRSRAASTIADACRFSLDELQYEYPDEPVPPGKTAQQHLEDLTWAGAQERYPKAPISGRHSGRCQKTGSTRNSRSSPSSTMRATS